MLIDSHCDTITTCFEKSENLFENTCHIDFKRLKEINSILQFFAVWLDKKYYNNAKSQTIKFIDFYYNQINTCDFIRHINTYNEFKINKSKSLISSLLSIEGGECLEGNIENLYEFYKRGVRALTITWNNKNELCDGIGVENPQGLTDFGKDVIENMEQLKMIIDVSHISEKGFWDIVDITSKAFIASHSNSKKICNNKRNLTDEQIKVISERGGIIGINLYSPFISNDIFVTSDYILKHIDHILNVGGSECIGFGCDFDGIDKTPIDITDISKLEILIDKIQKRYGNIIFEKITYMNFERVLKEIL